MPLRHRRYGRKPRRSPQDLLDAEILGRTLVSMRIAKGLTQDQLAALSGISRQAIFNIETGRSLPRWPTVMQVVRALGVGGTDLLAATDAALAEHRSAVAVPAMTRDEALLAAVELAHGVSQSLRRCLALLEVAMRRNEN
jgi:DNA-binding XRE family transcriptional regulator